MINSYSLNPLQSRVIGRNEGKIKSYGSCSDIRAWCHDVGIRDRYLREWMKSNMPICVMPVSTWTSLLRVITCRRIGKAIPRCHPNCKSKVILDSICATCEAMRETIKNDDNFEKYFDQEELDTSHWPSEKCLEALKSVKMMWKIIFEKVFKVNLSKSSHNKNSDCANCDNIDDIARIWTRDIIQQNVVATGTLRKANRVGGHGIDDESIRQSDCSALDRERSINDLAASRTICSKIPRKKISRYVSVRRKMIDAACEAVDTELIDELKACKTNLYQVQELHNAQYREIKKLKSENISLKLELQNIYKTFPWKSPFQGVNDFGLCISKIPKPFESFDDDIINTSKTENVDSEMIITLQKCQNKSLKNIEILQVLHKTNANTISNQKTGSKNAVKKEDPILLLKKVQNTFGAMFRREMSIAVEGRRNLKTMDINATIQRVHSCNSAPSCSSFSAYSSCSN